MNYSTERALTRDELFEAMRLIAEAPLGRTGTAARVGIMHHDAAQRARIAALETLVPLARLGLEAHKAGMASLNFDKYPAGRIVADGVRFGVVQLAGGYVDEFTTPFPFPRDTPATVAARAILDHKERPT